jgi:hypothetical protein
VLRSAAVWFEKHPTEGISMNGRFVSCVATLTTFAILSAVPVFSSAQECIQITAQITQTNIVKLGNAPSYWTFPVTCSVWKNQWRIDQWKIDNRYAKKSMASGFYDGTNVYSSLEIVPEGEARTNNNLPRTITILPSPGGHPLGNLGLNIPWLAFCSGSYLKLPNRIVPLPVMDVPGSPDSLSLVDKTTTFDDEGGLPKTIELLTSKERYLNSLSDVRLFRNPNLLHAQLTQRFSLPDQLVRFRYVVETFTNFNGKSYPTLFRYFDYRNLNNSSNLSLVAEGVGKMTSIRQVEAPAAGNVFLTSTNQTVIDLRFRQRDKLLDGIVYAWPKAELPSTNDPALLQRLKEMLSDAPAVKSEGRVQ